MSRETKMKLPAATTDETCPYCGATIGDLWDYQWRDGLTIKTDSPCCNKPIEIEAEHSVTYTISARVK